jgi:hypothetical protein
MDTPSAPRAANALHTLMDAARDPLREVLLSAGYNRRYTGSVHILIRVIRRSDHTGFCSLASNEVDGVQQRIMRGPVALVPSGLRREEANRDAVHEADLCERAQSARHTNVTIETMQQRTVNSMSRFASNPPSFGP